MQRNQRGFTLIELVVVVIIIGVLAAASVPIYRNYVRRSTLSEGRSIAGSIINGEKIYFTENAVPVSTSPAEGYGASSYLGIDITSNKYFNNFSVTTTGSDTTLGYVAYITGNVNTPDASGITITITHVLSGIPTITDSL